MKKLGISLSGGGAKAIIYIGVLQAIVESNIEISVIGGLSGGALVAVGYAAGLTPAQILKTAQSLNVMQIVDRNPFDGIELIDHQKLGELIKSVIGSPRLEELNLPTLVFASDVEKKKVVVFKEGSAVEAILSSCSLPPIMKPHNYRNMLLVDGGFSIKFGAEYFRLEGADIVVGVNLEQWLTDNQLPTMLREYVQSVRTMTETMRNYEQKLTPVDLEICGFADTSTMLDFKAIRGNLYELGYNKAVEYIPQIKRLLTRGHGLFGFLPY